jgi:ribonuclease Z
MKFSVIGTWNSRISPGRKNTSFLLDGNTLLDCGPHTVEGLINSGVDLKNIKTVLITHMHLDHFSGVPELIWQRALRGIIEEVNIIGPEKIEENTKAILKYYNTPDFMLAGVKFNACDKRIKFAPGIHTIEDNTYRINISGKNIFYSGDTSYSKAAIENGNNCDIFIHEATYCDKKQDEAKKYGHSTVSDAFNAFTESNSKLFIPTHMSTESKAQLITMKNTNILIPEDGMEYSL